MKKTLILSTIFVAFIGASCKVDDPFVDRVVAPVLVIFEDSNGTKTSGLTTEPSVTSSASADASITVRLLELNKDGLLDFAVGIDSIPAKSDPVTFKFRTGTKITDVVTDTQGRSTVKVSWKTRSDRNSCSWLFGFAELLGNIQRCTIYKIFQINSNQIISLFN